MSDIDKQISNLMAAGIVTGRLFVLIQKDFRTKKITLTTNLTTSESALLNPIYEVAKKQLGDGQGN